VAVRTGLVNLLRARAAFAAKVVFRYRLHADKLIGITGLAPPSMSFSEPIFSLIRQASPAFFAPTGRSLIAFL
jgi:hypothetical protein